MVVSWQLAQIPLAAGLQQRTDPRAMEPPALEVCQNAQFDEVGGIQKRRPYEALAGTAPSNIRRLAVYNGELIAFTEAGLYSYSESTSEWTLRSAYPAPRVTEEPVFVRLAEQTEADRGELSDVVWYTWVEDSNVFLAARDKTTGAVLYPPTSQASSAARPRLLALTNYVLLFYLTSGNVYVRRLDPTDPDNPGSQTLVNAASDYDVTQLDSTTAVLVLRPSVVNYTVDTVTESLVTSSVNKIRAADGPVAIAASGSSLLVVRSSGTGIQADPLNASDRSDRGTVSLAVGTATGTPVDQITAVGIRNSGDTESVYTVFFSAEETALATPAFLTRTNTVTVFDDMSAHVVGSQADLVKRVGVASRAFAYASTAYVWLAFASRSDSAGMADPVGFPAELQNTYFLYDAAGTLHAKALGAYGGGFQTRGHLPEVQDLGSNVYAWAPTMRRIIPLSEDSQRGYSARAPARVELSFDDDHARRAVTLGETLYIAGGQLLQYDGTDLVEVGFHVYPWYHEMAFTTGAGGDIDAVPTPGNAYAYIRSWRYDNAKGERERSTTATTGVGLAVQPSAATGGFDITGFLPLHTTRKGADVSAEIWRTQKNPVLDVPFYLVTDQDPDNDTGDNRFVANDPTADNLSSFRDEIGDDDVRRREPWPENGGVLASTVPPQATVLAVSQDRLFLAGIANAPFRVVYSRLRGEGEIASFNEALQVDLPPDGGDITALAFLNETLVAFKERAIYTLPGIGVDNVGGGQNYGPARLVATDVGAQSAEAVAVTPEGLLFRSAKGWYLLDRGWSVQYVGAPVVDFDNDTIVAIDVLEGQHQVRITSSERILVYDTLVRQWSDWTVANSVGAVMWQGRHVVATASSVLRQRTDYTGADYSLDIETAWIKTAGLQGFKRARTVTILGENRGATQVRMRVARNYAMSAGAPDWFDDKVHTPSPATVGAPLQVKHRIGRQKCESVKFRFSDSSASGEGMRLTGLALEYGIKRGPMRLPAAQRQ